MSLLQDQDKGGGHDVRGIASRRVEQRFAEELDRRAAHERRAIEAAVRPRRPRLEFARNDRHSFANALERAVVEEEVGGIDKGREARRLTFKDLALGARGDAEDPEHLTSRDRGLGLRQIEGPRRHVCGLMGVERLDDGPADLGTVVIDDSDRDVANELPDVRLRIEDRIEERSHDDETEGAGVPQHAAVLVTEGAGDADAPRKSGWRKRLWPRRRVAKNAPRPEPGKAEQDHRQSAEPSEGLDRVVGGHTAGRLIEQDLDVPAKRQQRTPRLPERSHSEGGKADAGETESW